MTAWQEAPAVPGAVDLSLPAEEIETWAKAVRRRAASKSP